MIADKPRPVTGPDGDNPITDEQIRELRDEVDYRHPAFSAANLALCGARPDIREMARARCAAFWNARLGGSS